MSIISKKCAILNFLKNSEDFVSGEEMCQKLHVSRTAVWKHIKELKKEGYMITSYTKRGYKLISTPDKVSENEIVPYLKTTTFGKQYYYNESVDSTNLAAKILAEKGVIEGGVVSAEEQTNGKGRLGRMWCSPHALGLYFSIIIRPKIPTQQAPQLTLVVASVLAKVLNENYQIPAKIKWPNDIVVNGKKLSGILVEMSSDIDCINYAVIGIGINVNNTEQSFAHENFNYSPTSMCIEVGEQINRSDLLVTLLKELEIAYNTFIESGFHSFKTLWELYAFSINSTITVTTANKKLTGILTGIDTTGALLLNINNEMQTIYSGEIIL